MFKNIDDKIRDIKFDNRSGATQLAKKSLHVLKYAVQTIDKDTRESFLEYFNDIGKKLIDARPGMACIQNLVAQTIYEVNNCEEKDLILLKKFAISKIDELYTNSELAVRKISEYGADLIDDGEVVLTCSYSSTVCRTFRLAERQGKKFNVLIAESRSPNGSIYYGRLVARELSVCNIPVEIFHDESIEHHVSQANKVFVGADSILVDGSLINGIPTYEVALAAKYCNVPFYTICETTKFNVLSHFDIKLEKGFDITPSELITGTLTEKGLIKPYEVKNFMNKIKKYFRTENTKTDIYRYNY